MCTHITFHFRFFVFLRFALLDLGPFIVHLWLWRLRPRFLEAGSLWRTGLGALHGGTEEGVDACLVDHPMIADRIFGHVGAK